MKPYFFLSILYFLLANHASFSQTAPSFKFSPKVASELFGVSGVKKELNCEGLVAGTWTYPNSQMTPFCYEASTSCIRYGLIVQKMKVASSERLKADLSLAQKDLELKLRGCQLALEAVLANPTAPVGELAGFAAY